MISAPAAFAPGRRHGIHAGRHLRSFIPPLLRSRRTPADRSPPPARRLHTGWPLSRTSRRWTLAPVQREPLDGFPSHCHGRQAEAGGVARTPSPRLHTRSLRKACRRYRTPTQPGCLGGSGHSWADDRRRAARHVPHRPCRCRGPEVSAGSGWPAEGGASLRWGRRWGRPAWAWTVASVPGSAVVPEAWSAGVAPAGRCQQGHQRRHCDDEQARG